MRKPVKLKFYSHIVTEHAEFEKWTPFAEKVVKLLNSDLKEHYPESFYFLHTMVKGAAVIYAGSMENLSYQNDPKFLDVIDNYESPSMSGDYTHKRRKGN